MAGQAIGPAQCSHSRRPSPATGGRRAAAAAAAGAPPGPRAFAGAGAGAAAGAASLSSVARRAVPRTQVRNGDASQGRNKIPRSCRAHHFSVTRTSTIPAPPLPLPPPTDGFVEARGAGRLMAAADAAEGPDDADATGAPDATTNANRAAPSVRRPVRQARVSCSRKTLSSYLCHQLVGQRRRTRRRGSSCRRSSSSTA